MRALLVPVRLAIWVRCCALRLFPIIKSSAVTLRDVHPLLCDMWAPVAVNGMHFPLFLGNATWLLHEKLH